MLLRLLLVLCISLFMLAGPAEAQIGISPRTLDVVLDQDGRSHSFRLFNLSKTSVAFTVDVSHWTMDEQNQVQLIPPSPSSLDQWMIVNPLRFEIPAGESQAIRVGFRPQMELPADEYRAMVHFKQVLPPDDQPEKKQLRSRFQINAAVYVHVGELIEKAEITQIKILKDEVEVHIDNTGNTHVRMDGQWSVWAAEKYPGPESTRQIVGLGKETAQLPDGVVSAGFLPTVPVLPGHQRIIRFMLEGLPEEKQKLILDMDAQFASQALDRAELFDWVGHEEQVP